jgi:signal transduction histidine kinase
VQGRVAACDVISGYWDTMEHRPLIDMLAGRAFPELAAAVRQCIPNILDRWQDAVRETMPKARQLDPLQLQDDAPSVLEHVARSLESEQPRFTYDFVDASAAHGEVRFEQNYNLAELLIEYNLIRAAVLHEVMHHLGRAPDSFEAIALNACLDIMARRSVQSFVDYQSGELKAATEAQSKYLSFLSHDLRGGLNGVFLMIEVLKRELAGETRLADTLTDLDAMRRSLLETVGTMDRFLHAERFRKGRVEVKQGIIHLRHLLNELISHFAYQAREKGLGMRVEAPAECMITSDRELLSLILQNVLSNAVKYTEKGEVVATAIPAADGGCVITIRDTGPGIAPERLSELFASFTRGETHGKPGVGLGLSIARQAAKYLGIKLHAESKLREGSTFFVNIPSHLPQLRKTGEGREGEAQVD